MSLNEPTVAASGLNDRRRGAQVQVQTGTPEVCARSPPPLKDSLKCMEACESVTGIKLGETSGKVKRTRFLRRRLDSSVTLNKDNNNELPLTGSNRMLSGRTGVRRE